MGEILPFRPRGPAAPRKGNTLCRNGHHKWILDKGAHFDVKQGRLVTRYRCARCGRTRVKAL